MKFWFSATLLFLVFVTVTPALAQKTGSPAKTPRPAAPAKNGGSSPLHKAVADGNYQQAATVLKSARQKSLVNAKDEGGKTPLMVAAEKNDTEMVKLLLRNGADKGAADKEGNTALDLAFAAKSKDAANVLMGMDSGGSGSGLENQAGSRPNSVTTDRFGGKTGPVVNGQPTDDPTMSGVYRDDKNNETKTAFKDQLEKVKKQ